MPTTTTTSRMVMVIISTMMILDYHNFAGDRWQSRGHELDHAMRLLVERGLLLHLEHSMPHAAAVLIFKSYFILYGICT